MHALGVFFVDFIYTNVNMKRAVILVGNTAILRIRLQQTDGTR